MKNKTFHVLFITVAAAVVFCAAAARAEAGCSGSGQSWTCTPGTSVAEVNSAIANATNGATITFQSGSYTWGAAINLSTTKGVTLLCAGSCTVSANGLRFSLVNWSGTRTDLYRISGFTFNNPSAYWLWFYCYQCTATLTNVRIDSNTFNMSSPVADLIVFGENASTSRTTVYGVIDKNTFKTTSGNSRAIVHYGTKTWLPDLMGTSKNLFIEDNVFDNASMTNAGLGAVDGNGAVSWVVRYNTFINGRIEHHGYYGSFLGYISSEVYGNTVIMNSASDSAYARGERAIKHQGSGEWIVFDNTVTALTPHGSPLVFQNYRSSSDWPPQCDGSQSQDGNRSPSTTYRGYPCNRQLGRDVNGVLKPMYFWNNKWDSGASITPAYHAAGSNDLGSAHLVNDRDFYVGGVTPQSSSSAPFNGSSGVGFGPLASRPATCSPTPESADGGRGGVGYWATDAGGNWNAQNASANDGALYRCSAANTWTLHYTPYPYPHPLRSGSTSSPTTPAPAAPTNLRIIR